MSIRCGNHMSYAHRSKAPIAAPCARLSVPLPGPRLTATGGEYRLCWCSSPAPGNTTYSPSPPCDTAGFGAFVVDIGALTVIGPQVLWQSEIGHGREREAMFALPCLRACLRCVAWWQRPWTPSALQGLRGRVGGRARRALECVVAAAGRALECLAAAAGSAERGWSTP